VAADRSLPALLGYVAELVVYREQKAGLTAGQGRPAPHKPLLLLFAIARAGSGAERLAPFDAWRTLLTPLLNRFAHGAEPHHPEYPFVRLANDAGELWELRDAPPAGGPDPSAAALIASGVGPTERGAEPSSSGPHVRSHPSDRSCDERASPRYRSRSSSAGFRGVSPSQFETDSTRSGSSQ
jgi:hypothetical protein